MFLFVRLVFVVVVVVVALFLFCLFLFWLCFVVFEGLGLLLLEGGGGGRGGRAEDLCLRLGFVHPLQDVALHQCLPVSSVRCSPNPGGSLLLCYVVLPSSAWSSS